MHKLIPIDVIEEGIVIEISPLEENILLPIIVRPLVRIAKESLEQKRNELSPIVTLLCIFNIQE